MINKGVENMLLKYIKFHYMYIVSCTRMWLVTSIVIIVNMILLSRLDIKNNQVFTFLALIMIVILSANLNQANRGCKSYLLLKLLPLNTKHIVTGEYICQIINYILIYVVLIAVDKVFFGFSLFNKYEFFLTTFIIIFSYFTINNIIQFSNIESNLKFLSNSILMGFVGGFSMSVFDLNNVLRELKLYICIFGIVILYILSYFISLRLFKKSQFN